MSKPNKNRPVKTGRTPRRSNRKPPAVGASPSKGSGCNLWLLYLLAGAGLVIVILC